MGAFSDRLLTALGPGALGKAAHRHFPESFFLFGTFGKKEGLAIRLTGQRELSGWERVLCRDHGHHRKTKSHRDACVLWRLIE